METRVAQVIDRVLVLGRTAAGHRAPGDVTSTTGLVTVYDGPEVRSTDDAIDSTFVVIGWSGDDDDSIELVARMQLTSGPIAAANRPRDEITAITCKAISHRADSVKEARDAALAEVAVFAQICRSDPSLGINTTDTIGGVRTLAWVTAGSLFQYLHNGYVAEFEFTINYQTRV